MLNLDQDKFITDYVTTFLATWAANEYEKADANHNVMKVNKPPVTHAIALARVAWCTLLDYGYGMQRAPKVDPEVFTELQELRRRAEEASGNTEGIAL